MNILKIIWRQQIFRKAAYMVLLMCFLLVSIANGEERRDENTYGGWTPLQLSIWNPVQLFGENRDVYGLRTSIFNGKNRDMYGLAFDLFTGSARNIYGFQIQGLGNTIYHGFGNNKITSEVGSVTGMQIGIGCVALLAIYPIVCVNSADSINGFQVGIVGNEANKVSGFQIGGIVNLAKDVTGMQIGCVNVVKDLGGFQIAAMMNGSDNIKGVQIGVMANIVNNDMEGLQISGIANGAGNVYGLEISPIMNIAKGGVKGVQIGLVNYCEKMTGIQIGAINIIKDGAIPVFPVINASFSF